VGVLAGKLYKREGSQLGPKRELSKNVVPDALALA
jgi:hypothetical protein